MRNASAGIHGVEPWPRAVFSIRYEKKSAIVEKRRPFHPCVEVGQSLGLSASGANTPQIHFVRCDETTDEVNIATVGRPGQVMVVHSRLVDVEPSRIASIKVG